MSAPRLELRGVSKTYANGEQPVEVLHDISLSAEAGTVTALLGRSGCGKSTLLNLAGAAPPARGIRLSILSTAAHADRAGECRTAPPAGGRRQDRRGGARAPAL